MQIFDFKNLCFLHLLIGLALLPVCAQTSQPPTTNVQTKWALSFDGVGPVKVGMTTAKLKTTLRPDILTEEESGNESCYYLASKAHPQLSFMIIENRIVRIDVNAAGIPTTEGVQVGDSEGKAKNVYGTRLKITAHQYTPTGHYLTAYSSNHRFGVRFETDKGHIESFYAGRADAIRYVEGCE